MYTFQSKYILIVNSNNITTHSNTKSMWIKSQKWLNYQVINYLLMLQMRLLVYEYVFLCIYLYVNIIIS